MPSRRLSRSTLTISLAMTLASVVSTASADRLPWYAQSPTAIGSGGAAATEHPLATQATITILNAGGNAVDAAVAASAVQGVVRPFSGGIGGGGYMQIYLADDDRVLVLDHRSSAPASFDEETFIDPVSNEEYDEAVRNNSGAAVGVPGVVKAWEKAVTLYGSGTVTLAQILQPAIDVAEDGFYADANYIREVTENQQRLCAFTSTIAIYLGSDCSVPAVGTLVTNQDLADMYQLIATNGSSAFYSGAVASAIVSTVNSPPVRTTGTPIPFYVQPGNMLTSDLSGYSVPEYAALHVNYRGYDVYGPPPSSSGGTTIGEMLNVLEGYPMASLPREQALHYYLETSRRGFADRSAYLGDPLTYANPMPVDGLLSENYAEHVRQRIQDRGTQRFVAASDPWPFDANPLLKAKPLPADGAGAVTFDFTGLANGASWDSGGQFVSGTRTASESIEVLDESGDMQITSAQFSYVRAAAQMDAAPDTELLVRFKPDSLTGDRRLRFWLRADGWNATTSPFNGYAVEISSSSDTVRIIRTRNGNAVFALASFTHARSLDWQWLRFRVEGDQLSVRFWDEGDNEPRHTWTHTMQDTSVTAAGGFLTALIELGNTATSGGGFRVDDMFVTDLKPVAFSSNFTAANGASWGSQFTTQFGTGNSNPGVGASINVQSNAGRLYLDKTQFAYARATTDMAPLTNSELLVRFRMNELTDDRSLRFWLRADSWNSLGSPHNGYGIEIQSDVDQVRMFRVRQSNGAFALRTLTHTRTTAWQWMRFRVEGATMKVRIWADGSPEPLTWLGELSNPDVTAPGKLLIGALENTGGTGVTGGSFDIDDLAVYDLDVMESGGGGGDDGSSTIHLTTADGDGNIVAYTHTLNSIGGNGAVVPGYGFILNNELNTRVPSKSPVGHPNGPRPGMRPLSSMAPTMVFQNGNPVLAIGSPGGETIITTVLQVLLNRLDFGMTLPVAVEQPRATQRNTSAFGHTLVEPEFALIPEYDDLLDRGQLFDISGLTYGTGAVNAVEFLPGNKVRAVSEAWRRGGGSAMVQTPDP